MFVSSSFLVVFLLLIKLSDLHLQTYQILNSDDHTNFLKRNGRNPADYRPDIVHQVCELHCCGFCAFLEDLRTKFLLKGCIFAFLGFIVPKSECFLLLVYLIAHDSLTSHTIFTFMTYHGNCWSCFYKEFSGGDVEIGFDADSWANGISISRYI